LRLVGVRNYDGLWAGIWRSGTDPYYLWANVNESSFLAKWSALAGQNLRLIDMIVMPVGGGATGASMGGASANLEGERFGSSELRATISSTRTDASNSTATGSANASNGAGEGGGNLGASAAPGTMGVGTGGGGSSLTETAGQGGGSFLDATLATTEAQGEGGGSVDLATAARFEGIGEGGGAAMPISFSSDMLGEGGGSVSPASMEPANAGADEAGTSGANAPEGPFAGSGSGVLEGRTSN
jgi:hypothetical protein